jgi:hypothetical protein
VSGEEGRWARMLSEISEPGWDEKYEPGRDGRPVPPRDPAVRGLARLIADLPGEPGTAREGEPKPRDAWVTDIFW